MKLTHLGFGWVILASVAATGSGYASPGDFNRAAFDLSGALDHDVAPTRTALEVVIGGGYIQGAGGAGSAGYIEDLTSAGGDIEVQLGIRATPRFSLGVYGTYARFRHGDTLGKDGRAHGATAGVLVTWHGRQTRSVDPWISVGAGWRGLWLSPSGSKSGSLHGAELLRVQLGYDYRLSPCVALSPLIGASGGVFVVEDTAMTNKLTAVHDKKLHVYGFVGILGRFDLGG